MRLLQEVGTQLKMDFAYPDIMHYPVFEYNNGALGLDKSTRATPRTRYIYVKYHIFIEHVGEGRGIIIQRMESKYQKDDVFTK